MLAVQMVLAVWAVVEHLAEQVGHRLGSVVLPIQAVVEAEVHLMELAEMAVQALSLFATPAQFNISLVAQ
jgi:hypothetical protein